MQDINLQECHEMVKEFHTKFRFKKQTFPQRDAIWDEEYNEWLHATNDIDKLDGLVDMLYVWLGTMINFNLIPYDQDMVFYRNNNTFSDFNGAFREVHRSNMSKSCKTLDEVYKTIAQEKYKNLSLTYENVDGLYFVKDSNQKLIKSIDYSKAILDSFV